MNKKFIFLMTLMLLIGFTAKEVYAATIKFGEYRDFNELLNSILSNLSSNGNYMKGIIDLIGYLLGPFLLIYFLVEGILMEINFFSNNEKYNSIIALAMALIAMAGGVSLAVARYVAEYGVLAILTFFAAVLILGLSFYYRKKAREYGFFLGSKILTHLLVHSPLILTMGILGYFIVPYTHINLPSLETSVLLAILSSFFLFIFHYGLALKLMNTEQKRELSKYIKWFLISILVIGAGSTLLYILNINPDAQINWFGFLIGASFGIMISVLNRHAAAHEVLSRALKNQEDLWKTYHALHELRKIVLSKMNEGGIARKDISDSSVRLIKDFLKVDIDKFFKGKGKNDILDTKVANEFLDQINEWIKDVERMLEYEKMKAEHQLIEEHQQRVSSTS